jgi:hypothetical protein
LAIAQAKHERSKDINATATRQCVQLTAQANSGATNVHQSFRGLMDMLPSADRDPDKISSSRQTAIQICLVIKENATAAFDEAYNNLPKSVQVDLASQFEPGPKIKEAVEPTESPEGLNKECPKFLSQSTQAKTLKLLEILPPKVVSPSFRIASPFSRSPKR